MTIRRLTTLTMAAGLVAALVAPGSAATRTPIWITHGTSDPVLPVTNSRTSSQLLREAYVAAGADPAEAADLIRFTEFPDEAYSLPDYHAVVGPAYETRSILHWLLEQQQGASTPMAQNSREE